MFYISRNTQISTSKNFVFLCFDLTDTRFYQVFTLVLLRIRCSTGFQRPRICCPLNKVNEVQIQWKRVFRQMFCGFIWYLNIQLLQMWDMLYSMFNAFYTTNIPLLITSNNNSKDIFFDTILITTSDTFPSSINSRINFSLSNIFTDYRIKHLNKLLPCIIYSGILPLNLLH